MTNSPEHLDLTFHNLSEDKKQELLRLFPEIRTEGGLIDFERLKLVLGETIDVGRECCLPRLPNTPTLMGLFRKLVKHRKMVLPAIIRIPPPFNHPSLKNLPPFANTFLQMGGLRGVEFLPANGDVKEGYPSI